MEDRLQQRVRETLSLPKVFDRLDSYFLFFSAWYRRVSKDYTLQEPEEYEKERQNAAFIVDNDSNTGEEVVRVTRDHVPWVVLAAHFMTGCSTNATYVSELLEKRLNIGRIPKEMVESIIAWSISGMHMDEKLALQALEARLDETESGRALTQSLKDKMQRTIWDKVFQHHLKNSQLNPIYERPGVVFFALFSLSNANGYSLLFIDYLTKAATFSIPCKPKNALDLIRDIRVAVLDHLRAYGQPLALICMNPCRGTNGWLGSVLQKAFKHMVPFDTVVSIYELRARSLPSRIAEVFEEATTAVRDPNDTLKNSQPFCFLRTQNTHETWEHLVLGHFMTLQNRSFVRHPRDLESGATSDNMNICFHIIYEVNLSLPSSKISNEAWSCIFFPNPFPKAKLDLFKPEKMPRALENELKEVTALSLDFTLSPETPALPADMLEFDETSRRIVAFCFRKRRDRVLPKNFVEELELRKIKRARKDAEESEKRPVEEAADKQKQQEAEKQTSGLQNAEEEKMPLAEEPAERPAGEKRRLTAEAEKQGLAEAEAEKLTFTGVGRVRQTEETEKQILVGEEAGRLRQAEEEEIQGLGEEEVEVERAKPATEAKDAAEDESQRLAEECEEVGRHRQTEEGERLRLTKEERTKHADEEERAKQADQVMEAMASFTAEKKRLAEEAERERLADKAAEEQRLAIEAVDMERAEAEEQSRQEVAILDSPDDSESSQEIQVEKTAAEEVAENLRVQEEWRRQEAERQKEIEAILAAERKEKAAKEAEVEAEVKAKAKARTEAETKANANIEAEAADTTLTEERQADLEDEEDLPPTNNPITAFLRTVKLALNRAPPPRK